MKMVIANNLGGISSLTAKNLYQTTRTLFSVHEKVLTTPNVIHLISNQLFHFFIFELVSFSHIPFKLLIFDCLKYMKYFD